MEGCALQTVSAASLSAGGRYSLRYRLDTNGLLDSVRRHGVLLPVVISPDGRLVAGHRRVQCAQALGLETIPALVTQEKESRRLFLISVLSNWNQNWSGLDAAWCLKKARECGFSEEELVATLLPAFGTGLASAGLEEFQTITALDAGLLEGIADGHIPFHGARALTKFKPADQRSFAELARQMALTTQELIKLCGQLAALLHASGKSLEIFLKENKLGEISLNPSWDQRMRAEKFCKAVQALAHPRQKAMEEKTAAKLKGAGELAALCKIEFPPGFEDQGYTLKARLKSPAQLERFLALAGSKREWLNSLFDFML